MPGSGWGPALPAGQMQGRPSSCHSPFCPPHPAAALDPSPHCASVPAACWNCSQDWVSAAWVLCTHMSSAFSQASRSFSSHLMLDHEETNQQQLECNPGAADSSTSLRRQATLLTNMMQKVDAVSMGSVHLKQSPAGVGAARQRLIHTHKIRQILNDFKPLNTQAP